MKLELTFSECEQLLNTVDRWISTEVKSNDLVKEFYLKESLESLRKRLLRMINDFRNTITHLRRVKKLGFTDAELIALVVFRARFGVHHYVEAFIQPLMKNIPAHLLMILENKKFIETKIPGSEYEYGE